MKSALFTPTSVHSGFMKCTGVALFPSLGWALSDLSVWRLCHSAVKADLMLLIMSSF